MTLPAALARATDIIDSWYAQSVACYRSISGVEACPLTKSALLSVDFVINQFLLNYLKQVKNTSLVKYCQECFSFDTQSDLWQKRVTKFEMTDVKV